jgi:hypothetical protein
MFICIHFVRRGREIYVSLSHPEERRVHLNFNITAAQKTKRASKINGQPKLSSAVESPSR